MDGITDSMDMSLSKLQDPGGGEGQGSLLCCSPWHRKEAVMTERLNNSVKQVHMILRNLSNGLKVKFTLNYY